MCLITKNGLKMIEFSTSLWENEIHMVDSPFNEVSKIYFFQGALISEECRPETLREMGNNRGSIVMQIGLVNFKREY